MSWKCRGAVAVAQGAELKLPPRWRGRGHRGGDGVDSRASLAPFTLRVTAPFGSALQLKTFLFPSKKQITYSEHTLLSGFLIGGLVN